MLSQICTLLKKGKATKQEENTAEKTMPTKRHEGYICWGTQVNGDNGYITILRSKLERFREIAKSRGVRADDLFRAGAERYGFRDSIDKIIAEEEKT